MRALLALAALAPAAAHASPAHIAIEHGEDWQSHGRPSPIAIRVNNGAWRTIPPGKTATVDVPVGPSGGAVAIDARVPSKAKSFRRWAALLPGAGYRIIGNGCAIWGLAVDGPPPADEAARERVRVDARDLPARAFPLIISSDRTDDEAPSDTVAVLDKPGVSAPVVLLTSAMCPRSGTRVIVRTRGAKKPLFDESLIPQPRRLHTLKLRSSGFSLTVD